MFWASWAWVCVLGKFCKFLKNQKSLFGNVPLCKKSQSFFILVSPDITDTFPFWKNFDGFNGWGRILSLGVGGAGQGKAVVAAFPVILSPETLRRGGRSRSVWCQHRSVIPAPIAYIKVVVVKKLVVGSGQWLEAVNFVVVLLCRRSADCWRFRGALNRVSLDASSRVLWKN